MLFKNLILIIILSFSPALFGKIERAAPTNTLESKPIVRDTLISVTARHYENSNYFQLKMLNESKAGFYSMVRIYADGTIESVAIKSITVNTINQPLLYCFADKKTPNVNFTYALYRISDKNEIVQLWHYHAAEKTIVKHSEDTSPVLVNTPPKSGLFNSAMIAP